jgi:hypothetical protein
VIEGDARGGLLQRLALFGGQVEQRRLQLALGQFQFDHRLRIEVVEAARVLQHGGIADGAHRREDLGHRPLDALVLGILEGQQRGELLGEIRVAGGQALNHAASAGPPQGGSKSTTGSRAVCG